MSFLTPVILCTQIVPIKSVAFEGASQNLSAALISQSVVFLPSFYLSDLVLLV